MKKKNGLVFALLLGIGLVVLGGYLLELTQYEKSQTGSSSQPFSGEIIEITSDELLSKFYQYTEDKEDGKDVAELEKWLALIKSKTIRVTGVIYKISLGYDPRTNPTTFAINFHWEKKEDFPEGKGVIVGHATLLSASNDKEILNIVKTLEEGDEVTIEGKFKELTCPPGRYFTMWIERIVKKY